MGKSGKIRRLCWKERLQISEIANFESDLLKSNIRYSSSESQNFTDICMVGGYKLAPPPLPPPGTIVCKSLDHFQTWQVY